jgi:1-acyl-sn-glycerol-3-phosphate acyltransferase
MSPRLYALVRLIVVALLRLWFRVRVEGAEHLPADGPAVIAPNHKSLMDPFFVGVAAPRPVRFMAKSELFRGPIGPLIRRLGAFPVRRGGRDAEAIETAREILREGGLVVVFPEGTRVDEPDALGAPRRGAGRLAIETGSPIVPTAITGTARLWLGPIPKPRLIRISFLAPVQPGDAATTREALAELIERDVWPAVQHEYGRLAATPGPVAAALAALGIGGGLLARHRRKIPGVPRLLGVVESRRARKRSARQRLVRRLRGRGR